MAASLKLAHLNFLETQQQHKQKLQQKKTQQQNQPKRGVASPQGAENAGIKKQKLAGGQQQQQQQQTPPTSATPVAMLVKEILEFLQTDPHKTFSAEQIKQETEITISEHKGLFEALRDNPFCRYQSIEGVYSYKSMYTLHNISDLLQEIAKANEGIDCEHLIDAYPSVEEDLDTLISQNKVFKQQNIDNKHEIVYPTQERFRHIKVFDEFKEMWNGVKIPDQVQLELEMSNAGLTMMDQEKLKTKRPSKLRKKSNKQRNIKLTNVHLGDTGIDLTKDFVVPP